MLTSLAQAVYLIAAILFVLSLAGLSKQETARRGNLYGMAGMGLALLATVALAVVVGYYVISNVSHSLHTPLMATTNAISGIILVGALLQIGNASWVVSTLAFVAATVAAINIFGGFLVAFRMIHMFRKEA